MKPTPVCSFLHDAAWRAPVDGYPVGNGLQSHVGRGPTRGWLVALDGVHRGEDFRLTEGANRLGSAYQADVALTGTGVSGSHAVLTCHADSADLSDAASREGTLVNGERVDQAKLYDGDELILGDVRLMFRLAAAFTPGYRPQLRPRPVVKSTPSVNARPYVCGWLVHTHPGPLDTDFRLLNGTCTLGSGKGHAIMLHHDGVAQRHAKLTCAQNQCTIRPTAKTQTVLVNGLAVTAPTLLRDSDTIRVGGAELYLKWF